MIGYSMRLVAFVWLFIMASLCAEPAFAGKRSIEPFEVPQIIESIAEDGPGLTHEEQVLVNKIYALGSPAIPELLLLLEHENENVCARASYTLNNIDGLTEKELKPLMNYMSAGNWRISPAIAAIGTPDAVAFLVEELKKEKDSRLLLLEAIESLGSKIAPSLADLFRINNVEDELLDAVISIFKEMGNEASIVVDPLTEIALDASYDQDVRCCAILALGAIGESASRSAGDLLKISEQNPDAFRAVVTEALANMKTPEAVPNLLIYLSETQRPVFFRDIAALGKNGVSAGPELVQYLHHDDWSVQINAARALGYIGYSQAIQPLVELLDNTDNWRLVFVAAESLGRLRSKYSVPALSRIAQQHWYPPVRRAAAKALEDISGIVDDSSGKNSRNFPLEFFGYRSVKFNQKTYAGNGDVEIIDTRNFAAGNGLSPSCLTNCTYKAYNNYLQPTAHQQVPDFGIEVSNGYLVGASRGEWGGELVHIDTDGNEVKVITDNVTAIYRNSEGIFVIAGLARLTINQGLVYKVERENLGNWKATKWKALPGAPISSALTTDGRIFVKCVSGTVVIGPDGLIRLADVLTTR